MRCCSHPGTKERLEWETEHDCVKRFREWIVGNSLATDEEMDAMEIENKKIVDAAKQAAWDAYLTLIRKDIGDVSEIFDKIAIETGNIEIAAIKDGLNAIKEPTNKDIYTVVGKVLRSGGRAGSADLRGKRQPARKIILNFLAFGFWMSYIR